MKPDLKRRLPQLDGLRGIAILAVLCFHLRYLDPLPDAGFNRVLLRLATPGWLGVDVFFVLSGFLITTNILRTRDKPAFWRNFYLRRAARILPPLLLLIPAACVAGGYPGLRRLAPYLFFFTNFAILRGDIILPLMHLWSLAIEEQFYLVWPLFAVRWDKRRLFRIAAAVAVFSALLRVVFFRIHVPGIVPYFLTFTHTDGLAAGSALALAEGRPLRFFQRHRRILVLGAAAVWLAGWAALHFNYASGRKMALIVAIPPVVLLTALTVLSAAEETLPSAINRVLSNNLLRWLGRRSYAIYLWHFPLMGIATQFASASPTLSRLPLALRGLSLAALVVLASVLVAEISWRLLERPALAFAQRSTSRRELLLVEQ